MHGIEYIDAYIDYIGLQKRYSARTCDVYMDVLQEYARFFPGEDLVQCLSRQCIRAYQVHLMDDKGESPRTVNLHLSVLSGFCRFLVQKGLLQANPVKLVTRPKVAKRLPSFFKTGAMEHYLEQDNALLRKDFELDLQTEQERRDTYWLCLRRAIVCVLYSTGMRRAELIGLQEVNVDFSRCVLRVVGKGDKMREIPLVASCIQEISLYLQARQRLVTAASEAVSKGSGLLFVTYGGAALYPVIVDRAVKEELGPMGQEFAGKKSPHMLRHSLATGLLEQGADLNSIKEVLGHANLAATQVYTHSSPAQLKRIYQAAHPRSKKK